MRYIIVLFLLFVCGLNSFWAQEKKHILSGYVKDKKNGESLVGAVVSKKGTTHAVATNEYGFYSNVNPERPHPRWSQASERRIGELKRRPTLMFNGYAEEVAHLYDGLDLDVNY